jgi:hypothetical protein
MDVTIHEFSKGFVEKRLSDERWVSGGFANPIDRSSSRSSVPPEIQQAVKRGKFKIPNGYSPATGKVALLARVITVRQSGGYREKYYVLAVANRQDEDKFRTDVVGYRYFWLENKSSSDGIDGIDGIEILLNWWLENNCPQFNMNPNQDRREDHLYSSFPQPISRRVSVPELYPAPILGVIPTNNRQEIKKLHEDASRKAEEISHELAWAWNVRRLENPCLFTAIWAENENYRSAIQEDLQRVGTQEQPTINSESNYTLPELEEAENALNEFANQLSDPKAQKVRESLLSASSEKLKQLFSSNKLTIQRSNDSNPVPEAIRYRALEPIFLPERIVDWLDWMKGLNAPDLIQNAFDAQKAINTGADSSGLQEKLDQGIQILLKNLLDRGSEESYQKIKWLLVDSRKNENIYQQRFKEYQYNQPKRFKEYQYNQPTAPRNILFLARLFKDAKNWELSAKYYKKAQDNVPSQVFWKLREGQRNDFEEAWGFNFLLRGFLKIMYLVLHYVLWAINFIFYLPLGTIMIVLKKKQTGKSSNSSKFFLPPPDINKRRRSWDWFVKSLELFFKNFLSRMARILVTYLSLILVLLIVYMIFLIVVVELQSRLGLNFSLFDKLPFFTLLEKTLK